MFQESNRAIEDDRAPLQQRMNAEHGLVTCTFEIRLARRHDAVVIAREQWVEPAFVPAPTREDERAAVRG